MRVRYKDIYGNWHLGNNDTISELEIAVDLGKVNVHWDNDSNTVKFTELGE